MLKKVRIKNFISCKDTEFDLEQITILIGRNAAGKTNILKTIQWISWFILGDEFFFHASNSKIEIEFYFLIDNVYLKYILNFFERKILEEKLLYNDNKKWNFLIERKDIYTIIYHYKDEEIAIHSKENISIIKAVVTFLPEEQIEKNITNLIQYLISVNYYTLEKEDENIDIVKESMYLNWISSKKELESSVMMRLLHAWDKDKEIFNEIQEILGKNGLNLIDEIIIMSHVPSPNEKLYFIKFSINDVMLDYRLLSFGTQRVLMILLALLYDKNSTLLIEQPEDGIHIGLLRKVLSICSTYTKAYNKQLIITTHSPDVINMFQPENIRIVRMTEQGTKVSPLDKERIPFIREYIENEGALSDFIEAMDDE